MQHNVSGAQGSDGPPGEQVSRAGPGADEMYFAGHLFFARFPARAFSAQFPARSSPRASLRAISPRVFSTRVFSARLLER